MKINKRVRICAGKGGVGKTFCAVSTAIFLASIGQKTLIIDYDGGHNVLHTLGITEKIAKNKIVKLRDNLYICIIAGIRFDSIRACQEHKIGFEQYFSQFPKDYGMIALNDMVHKFFGVSTDIPTLQKFLSLVIMLEFAQKENFENIVIDVEPTAGLERLLSEAKTLIESMSNLKDKGLIALTFIGANWPDIKKFLQSDYIANIDTYMQNVAHTVDFLGNASYGIVCTAESSSIVQVEEVVNIIRSYAGNIQGFIVNNTRDESFEAGNIARLDAYVLKRVLNPRTPEIHLGNDPIPLLIKTGERLFETFWEN
ncbi:MAG: ArsA-related P-loop ATPase [Patescibacteria group bacterium]